MRRLERFLVTAALLIAAAGGCGASVETGGGGGSNTGGDGGSTTTPSGGAGGSTTTGAGAGGMITTGTFGDTFLAIHTLRLGDKTPEGNVSSTAWQQYGFNLDGQVSTGQSVGLCKPADGGKPSTVYPDGQNGIDNGFGKNILPILNSLNTEFSNQVNQAIAAGHFTVILRIEAVGPGWTGTFPAWLYTASFPEGSTPNWAGADQWQVRSDCLDGNDLSSAKTKFPASSIAVDAAGQRYWNSVSVGDINIQLEASGFVVTLPIKHALITMGIPDDNKHGLGGMIGGIVDTEAFITELGKAAGSFDPVLCPPSSTFESIAVQIRQAQDILLDGTQDPNQTCNGISIGLGFDADSAFLGNVFTPAPEPDPCSP